MSSTTQTHLRTYVGEGIQQKMRLKGTHADYEEQKEKTTNRLLEQRSLRSKMVADGIAGDRVEMIAERITKDEEVLGVVEGALVHTEEEMAGITLRMNAHLEELSDIEIANGGFVAHAVGVGDFASFNSTTQTILLKPEGNVEIPIAVRMNQWRDGSQMTIKNIKKV